MNNKRITRSLEMNNKRIARELMKIAKGLTSSNEEFLGWRGDDKEINENKVFEALREVMPDFNFNVRKYKGKSGLVIKGEEDIRDYRGFHFYITVVSKKQGQNRYTVETAKDPENYDDTTEDNIKFTDLDSAAEFIKKQFQDYKRKYDIMIKKENSNLEIAKNFLFSIIDKKYKPVVATNRENAIEVDLNSKRKHYILYFKKKGLVNIDSDGHSICTVKNKKDMDKLLLYIKIKDDLDIKW